MIQRGAQIGRFSFKHESVVWFRIVQPSGTSAKKPQLVIRIAARPFDPLSVVIIPSRQRIANRPIPLRRQEHFNLPPQFVTDPFIRVQDEDPITSGLVNGKVFLLPEPVPGPLINPRGILPTNLERPILAECIHHNDLIHPFCRLEAVPDISFFIEHDGSARNRLPHYSPPSLTSKATPKHLPIKSPVQPAISACPPSLSCLQSRPHHGGMASAKLLQNRIVFKGLGVLIVQPRFGAGRRITAVNLCL